jgi:hypothetical protein
MMAGVSGTPRNVNAPNTMGGSFFMGQNTSKAQSSQKFNRSNVVMSVSGDTNIEQKEGHIDRIFLQERFDSNKDLGDKWKHTANKYAEELMRNAKYLVGPGKGILATDESNATMGKRLEDVGVPNSEQARNDWRELLYTFPDMEKSISGAIMYDETIRQSDSNGTPFPKLLGDKGILTGIKVDIGVFPINGTDGET